MKSIPKPVRTQVWNKYIGEENGLYVMFVDKKLK